MCVCENLCLVSRGVGSKGGFYVTELLRNHVFCSALLSSSVSGLGLLPVFKLYVN